MVLRRRGKKHNTEKVVPSMSILYFFLIVYVTLNSLCIADYTLEIIAVSYSNPSNKDHNGDCCDIGFFTCGKCDVDFHFCIRAKNTPATTTPCWYSKQTSDDKSDSSGINFPESGELYGGAGLSNPIKFDRSGSWPISFQLMVRITDSDGSTADDLVDRVTFDMNLNPSSSWTSNINGVKRYNRASFSAKFRVRCNANYYTSSCSVYCKARDDSVGHYDCNSSGQKVCKNGWSDPNNNCLTPICKSGCSDEGGYCNSPSQCLCRDGWTGTLCNECIPKSGCSSSHGHCEGPYTCICEEGYGGALCTKDADVCGHQSPCTHGGSCSNTGLDSYECDCLPGYTGTNCETEIDECASGPCLNRATCVDQVNGYVCQCAPGYTSSDCNVNIDDCAPDPCLNGSTCNDLVNGYTCSCLPGYVGTNCEGHKCDSTPCLNGTCYVSVSSESGYGCDCNNGYMGTNCESDIDECNYTECLNGGSCMNTPGSHYCLCAPGFIGNNCSINIDECLTGNCSMNSVCMNGIDSYTCTCDLGYTGDYCWELIDYCADADVCKNGGTCNSYIGMYGCNCPIGFTGSTCETNVDDCVLGPCKNGGTCEDQVNGFICVCSSDYTGTNCSTMVDHCDPNPCAANESCIIHSNMTEDNDRYRCVICVDDVCKDVETPAAIIGSGQVPFSSSSSVSSSSTLPTSDSVSSEGIMMMVGLILLGAVAAVCCGVCLGLICCYFCKRRRKRDMDLHEVTSFSDSARVSDNPMFITPDLLASTHPPALKDSSDSESPYAEIKDKSLKDFTNPLYSFSGLTRPFSSRPNSTSNRKQGYIALGDTDKIDMSHGENSAVEDKKQFSRSLNVDDGGNPYVLDRSLPMPHPPHDDDTDHCAPLLTINTDVSPIYDSI